jgi:protein TonB
VSAPVEVPVEVPVVEAKPEGSAGGLGLLPDEPAMAGNPSPDYLGLLQAWLERHKEYPRLARRRGMEGEVLLRFVMDRSGQVLEFAIERSSGHALLDREAEHMIERAQPLPAMPADLAGDRLQLVVPLLFRLYR